MTTAKPGRLSLVVRFLLLGLLALGAKRLVLGDSRAARPLTVEVPRDASGAEIERAIEEAMLLDVAERARLPQADPVVRERLIRSLAVIEDVADANAAVQRGVALGLHRQDVVARERLLVDARELLLGENGVAVPTDEEARAFLAANETAYAMPARVQFRQVFLSRQKRGAALAADASALQQQLADDGPEAIVSDAWAWTNASGQYSESRLDALGGQGFGASVMRAPVGVWTGPIASSFGLHFVWVTGRTPSTAAPTAVVLPRARADLAARERARARDENLQLLRAQYQVSWVRQP